jgi:signal transduction histidine kinase
MKLLAAPADQKDTAGTPDPGDGPAWRPSPRVMATLWAGVVLAALAAAALALVARGDLAAGDLFSQLTLAVSAIAYATLGALVVRRAGNVIGWIMLGEAAALTFLGITSAYGVIGLATYPGSLPAAKVAGLLSECGFPAAVFAEAFMFLLFPAGRLPSRRWRPVAAAGLALGALTTAGMVVHPRLVDLPVPGGVSVTFPNPLGVAGLGPAGRTILVGTLNGLSVVFVPFLAATFVSLAVRYRAGGRLLRQQVKWLVLTAIAFVAGQVIAVLGTASGQAWLTTVSYTALQLIALFGIPAAMAIAILRHRLFDIDVIISRALVYGLLSAAVTGVYAGIVLGIGTFAGHRAGPALTIAAAVSIALLFQPARHRAQRLANRLVYGERASPYQALADFAADMAGQLDLNVALDRLVSLLAGATGADQAQAWIRVGLELQPVAVWPAGSAAPAAVMIGADGGLPPFTGSWRAEAVLQGGELLGALSLQKPRSEALTPAEDELLQRLAAQAGLVLRNGRLTVALQASIVELRASRRRLVEAQDAERRKIERDLHDGAQQQLVALAIQLGVLEGAAEDPALIKAAVPELKAAARAALEDLRDLARGIYPPLLAEQGLAAALRAQAAKASLPVQVDAGELGRYPPDTESTVYFCVLEALQNAAKHARGSRATVRVLAAGDVLEFSVCDDGPGFDAALARRGSGLQGMTDRLAALGGTIRVRSRPGHGTAITGRLPARPEEDRRPVPEPGLETPPSAVRRPADLTQT